MAKKRGGGLKMLKKVVTLFMDGTFEVIFVLAFQSFQGQTVRLGQKIQLGFVILFYCKIKVV